MNRIALMCMDSAGLPWSPGVSAGLQESPLVSRGLCWSSLPQYLLSPTFKAGPHTPVSCQLGASTYCRASSKCTFRVFSLVPRLLYSDEKLGDGLGTRLLRQLIWQAGRHAKMEDVVVDVPLEKLYECFSQLKNGEDIVRSFENLKSRLKLNSLHGLDLYGALKEKLSLVPRPSEGGLGTRLRETRHTETVESVGRVSIAGQASEPKRIFAANSSQGDTSLYSWSGTDWSQASHRVRPPRNRSNCC